MSPHRLLLLTVAIASCAFAQGADDVVKKDSISVHTVERGTMPLFAPATGTLISLEPARAVLRFESRDANCEKGRAARLVVGDVPRPLAGRVEKPSDNGACEAAFVDKLPENASLGTKVRALIAVKELRDVVFFGRPADAKANTTATVFVLEGPAVARRVTVQYGAVSGPLIQIVQGLAPGDKVIVTDMSKWAHLARVRLE